MSQQLAPSKILDEVKSNFESGQRRRFLPGLLIAFINFIRALDAVGKFETLNELFAQYPRIARKENGQSVNTLTVQLSSGKTLSIRRYYDAIANWFRADQKRFDYPSSAPHATQAWTDYTHWLEALLKFSSDDLDWLEREARQFVLDALPSQAIDPTSVVKQPPRFLLFLERFDMTAHKGEATGSAYQGTVFGYIRADAPHLQVEVGKVRTGSKREKRVGDIDARDGANLALSAEVKQFRVGPNTLPDLAEFSKLIAEHGALGLVVALDFEQETAQTLIEMGLQPISKSDLIQRVRLWDPLKQQIAVNALLYYVGFREQNSALYSRIRAFLEDIEESFRPSSP